MEESTKVTTRATVSKKEVVYKVLFYIWVITLVEYLYYIAKAVIVYHTGINTNWFITSLGKDEWVYGWLAVNEVYEQFLVMTVLLLWPLRIFQVIFGIIVLVKKVRGIKNDRTAKRSITNSSNRL